MVMAIVVETMPVALTLAPVVRQAVSEMERQRSGESPELAQEQMMGMQFVQHSERVLNLGEW